MTYEPIEKKLPASDRYRVFVDGTELNVIKDDEYDYVHIITADIVSVEVVISEKIERIDLRPIRRAKKFTVDGQSVKFLMSRADYYCLEVNGDLTRPLLLFCDEKIEKQIYDGQKVIYFAKNSYFQTGVITPESNTVIFIDEGAVVEGKILAKGVKNLRILGNGTLYGKNHEIARSMPLDIHDSDGIEINGITIIGLNTWNLRTRRSKNILIHNVKILAHEIWSDGIDIVSSENVVIRHIFIKNEDDCVCIKSANSAAGNYDGADVRNVLVEDCVFWSGPRGNSLEIGYETSNSVVENLLFRNVDVIHRQTQDSKFHRSIIAIHNSAVRAYPYGISKGQKAPCVTRNITFENIKILGDKIESIEDAKAHGFDIDEYVENIKFV